MKPSHKICGFLAARSPMSPHVPKEVLNFFLSVLHAFASHIFLKLEAAIIRLIVGRQALCLRIISVNSEYESLGG